VLGVVMEIQSAFNSGVQGLASAESQLNKSASNIASSAVKPETETQAPEAKAEQQTSISQEMVNLKVAEHEAQSSAKVIQTADDVMGTLVDVTA